MGMAKGAETGGDADARFAGGADDENGVVGCHDENLLLMTGEISGRRLGLSITSSPY